MSIYPCFPTIGKGLGSQSLMAVEAMVSYSLSCLEHNIYKAVLRCLHQVFIHCWLDSGGGGPVIESSDFESATFRTVVQRSSNSTAASIIWTDKQKKGPPLFLHDRWKFCTTHLRQSGKKLFIRVIARAFRKLLSVYVFSYFSFNFEGMIWDLIVSVPDRCLSFYFEFKRDNFDVYMPRLTSITPNYHFLASKSTHCLISALHSMF